MTYCGWIGKSPSNVDNFEDSESTNCRCFEKSPSNSYLPILVFLFSTPDLDKSPKAGRSIWGKPYFRQVFVCLICFRDYNRKLPEYKMGKLLIVNGLGYLFSARQD